MVNKNVKRRWNVHSRGFKILHPKWNDRNSTGTAWRFGLYLTTPYQPCRYMKLSSYYDYVHCIGNVVEERRHGLFKVWTGIRLKAWRETTKDRCREICAPADYKSDAWFCWYHAAKRYVLYVLPSLLWVVFRSCV